MSIFAVEKPPLTISGGSAWFDMSDTSSSNIISSGGLVSYIRDKFGNGSNATQGVSSAQPTSVANIINNNPVLRFNGISQTMNFNMNYAGQDYTLFAVCQRRNSADFNYVFSGNNPALNLGWRTSSLVWHQQFTGPINNVASITVDAYSSPKPTILVGCQSGSTLFASIDDSSQHLTATTTISSFVSSGSSGVLASFNSVFAAVDIGELIAYKKALNATDLAKIKNYLSNKWGISL